MKKSEQKRLFKFLKKISRMNSDAKFYFKDCVVLCDISDSDRIGSLLEVETPKKYFLDYPDGRQGQIYKVTGRIFSKKIGSILCLDLEKESGFEDFILYSEDTKVKKEKKTKEKKSKKDVWKQFEETDTLTVGNAYGQIYSLYNKPKVLEKMEEKIAKEKKPGLFIKIKNSLSYRFSKRTSVESVFTSTEKEVKPEVKPIRRPVVETIPAPKIEETEKKVEEVKPAEVVTEEIKEAEKPVEETKPVEVKPVEEPKPVEIPAPIVEEDDEDFDEENFDSEKVMESIPGESPIDELKRIREMYQSLKNRLYMEYARLGSYEKELVDDAIANNLTGKDPEFKQMLNERTVSKGEVTFYMGTYDSNMEMMKSLEDSFIDKTKVPLDFNMYTINTLRKFADNTRTRLTGAELAKHNLGKLTKRELVEILSRIDEQNYRKEIHNLLSLR